MKGITFTKGGFLYDSYGTEYIGNYHTDGIFYYAGRVLGVTDKPLYPLDEIRGKRYYLNKDINTTESDRPRLHIPSTESEDFTNGFIYRYVAQKRNYPASVVEISREQFESYGTKTGINLTLWKVEMFKWYIIGDLDYLVVQNSKSLKGIEKEFPLIRSYYKNLSQHGKNSYK